MKKSPSAASRRYIIGPLLSLLIALTLIVPGHAQEGGAAARLEPDPAQVGIGQTVAVQIVVENVAGLRGVEARLTFDAALLEVVDAEPETDGTQVSLGPFLAVDSPFPQNTVNQESGLIDFSYSQMSPETGVSGAGAIATITFRGKATGTSEVAFSNLSLVDADGAPIQVTAQNGQVVVAETESPTETPTATPTDTPAPTSTATLTGTVTPTSTPSPSCGDVLGNHVVQPAETVYAIARAYRVRPDAIALCNNLINPSLIHPGDQLAIPDVPWFPIPPGPAAQPQIGDGTTLPCRTYHTVQWGENLFRISQHHGVSMWAVAEANGIYNLHYIRAGQVLCIP
jgi:LysM repeat protein